MCRGHRLGTGIPITFRNHSVVARRGRLKQIIQAVLGLVILGYSFSSIYYLNQWKCNDTVSLPPGATSTCSFPGAAWLLAIILFIVGVVLLVSVTGRALRKSTPS